MSATVRVDSACELILPMTSRELGKSQLAESINEFMALASTTRLSFCEPSGQTRADHENFAGGKYTAITAMAPPKLTKYRRYQVGGGAGR